MPAIGTFGPEGGDAMRGLPAARRAEDRRDTEFLGCLHGSVGHCPGDAVAVGAARFRRHT